MRHPWLLPVTLAILAGCAAPSLTSPPSTANRPAEPLGGLTFTPLSAGYSGYLTGAIASGGAYPSVVPSASSLAPGGPVSGNINGGSYNYVSYGGSPSTPMALVSITQAEAPGSRGPLIPILKAIVAPVLKDWAPDAKLISSNASLDNQGQSYPASPMASAGVPGGGYGDAGWRLSYQSSSRNESLSFYVQPEKTVVIRMRWEPLNLAEHPPMVDADEAIAKLSAAIKNPTAQSVEENTGQDYFLGTGFATMPSAGPMPGGNPYERVEPVYEVPASARWNANLQSILGKQVWELTYTVSDMSPQVGGGYIDATARGLVDAQTGAVIRFTRPAKHTWPQPSMLPPGVVPSFIPTPPSAPPMPMPSVMPSA